MKKIDGYDNITASGDFERLPVGGYVIKITDVEDVPMSGGRGDYLRITYDIAEGEHSGFYSDDWGKKNLWAHQFTRSYKETALGMFKAFTNAVEASNPGYEWNWDEDTLVGKELGAVIQNRIYEYNGETKQALEVARIYPAQDIRNGDFKVPAPRDTRDKQTAPASSETTEPYGDLPF